MTAPWKVAAQADGGATMMIQEGEGSLGATSTTSENAVEVLEVEAVAVAVVAAKSEVEERSPRNGILDRDC